MNAATYPASGLKDLELHEHITDILEQGERANFQQLTQQVMEQTDYILHGLELQLYADPLGMVLGFDILKLKCVNLMSRLLTQRTLDMQQDEILCPEDHLKGILLGVTQMQLEKLFIVYCSVDLGDYLIAKQQ